MMRPRPGSQPVLDMTPATVWLAALALIMQQRQVHRQPGRMSPVDLDRKPHPADFYRGLDLFNRRFYYECHDLWEEVWAGAKGKDKLFYQALIMSAVSLYHYGNENLEGALSCHRKATERFRQLPDCFLRLDISQFVARMETFYRGLSTEHTRWTRELRDRPRPTIQLES